MDISKYPISQENFECGCIIKIAEMEKIKLVECRCHKWKITSIRKK